MADLVVDTQHHWFGPRYRAALVAEAARDPAFAAGNALTLEIGADHPAARLHLDELDTAGIDVAVLSQPPPSTPSSDPAAAAATAEAANDELIEACAQAPDRLLVLAALPLPHVAESIAELDRVSAHPEVRGLSLGVNGLGHAP